MVKQRRRTRRKKKSTGGVKMAHILAVLIIVAGIYYMNRGGAEWAKERILGKITKERTVSESEEKTEVGLPALTKPRSEVILHRAGYTLSYNPQWKIPNWVAWTLTPGRFKEVVSRTDKFLPDPELPDPVTTDDYRRAGFDRGHMCPAADNKWSLQAMKESFYMSNICPQHHNLNRGDWKELEDACREWTYENGRIYVVCGPVLYNRSHRTIGTHRVVVPEAFYKVVLSLTPAKAIGFIYKNTSGNHPLDSYTNTVDEVERITGIDFFGDLPDDLENRVESAYDLKDWVMPGR